LIAKYPYAFFGFVLGLGVYVLVVLTEFDLFERLVASMAEVEAYELDEILIPLTIFLGFMVAEFFRQRFLHLVVEERSKVYRAMLSSSYHVLNNFLNQMQIIKLEAEKSDDFDPEILSLYGKIVEDAQNQLDALSKVTDITEKQIKGSIHP